MTDTILVINAGSSSIKFALYDSTIVSEGPLISGKITGIGRAPDFIACDARGQPLEDNGLGAIEKSATHDELILRLLEWISNHGQGTRLVAVGHRVVHGGRVFTDPVVISADVMEELGKLTSLAPLHQPHNLAAIRAISDWASGLPQVACFDTSFHRSQPRLAQLFALPRALSDAGVIRYGFHGISYQYIAKLLPEYLGARADGRVVVAHLGNGASLCAMKQRCSIASSMGFTALDGLMMGQRCGSLDAGVVLYLLQNQAMSIEQVEHLLYRESGLLGVSGISNNMQVLHDSPDPHAREAIELFCYRAAGELGLLLSPLQGLDAIVFTAGIGENAVLVRQLICDHLAWLGVELDQAANNTNATRISSPNSKIDVLVIPTNEEAVIAEATHTLIANSQIEIGASG
ncbi:MAG: acetate/propionate family kinase [Porticoccus sp.]|nr:acetate/propionate family kinase [Porticoccus sp.]